MRRNGKVKGLNLCLAVVLILSVIALAGCGNQGNQNAGGQPNTSNPNAGVESDKSGDTDGKDNAEGVQASPDSGDKTILTIWGWADQAVNPMIELYEKVNPKVKMNYVTVKAEDYVQKLQTALTADMDMPDICMLELDYRGRLFELDCWENLEEDPYNFDRNQYFDYANTIGTNSRGEIVALQWDFDTAGLAYKRELAKEYFGTDDPDELHSLLPDWDAFIRKGQEVKEKSNGAVYMMPGIGDMSNILNNQDPSPMVEGNVAKVTNTWGKTFESLVKFRDSGVVDKLVPWSPSWSASYALDQHIFYPCATWCIAGVIEPNNPDTDGRWGLMLAPEVNYTWGGTALAITSKSPNKQDAWGFLETVLLSPEGGAISKDPIGYYSCKKSFYDDPDYVNWRPKSFGGQNVGEVLFVEGAKDLKAKPITKYDHVIRESGNLIMQQLENDTDMTAEQALEALKTEIANRVDDLIVE